MSSATDTADDTDESGITVTASRTLARLRRSFLAVTAFIGVIMIVLGATVIKGVFAALFGIWGGMLISIGVLGIAIINLLRRL